MSTSNNTSRGGIGLGGILGIVFIILKLTKTIDWSWWWVTAPFWIPFIGFMFFIAFCLGMAFIAKKIK